MERMPRWARELTGVALALTLSVVVVGAVASSGRSELLFRDGDSLLTSLVALSLDTGRPQDWAMSTVLFLPELGMFLALWRLGLGVDGTLALSAVVNLVALYGAFRVVSGARGRSRAPITGALLAFAAFAALAAADSSASRDALELASLTLTTTYYSATVIASVAAIGLARRALDRGALNGGALARRALDRGALDRGAADRGALDRGALEGGALDRAAADGGALDEPALDRGALDEPALDEGASWAPVVWLAAVAAASVLSNPLFAVWATVPVGLVLAGVAVWRRSPRAVWAIVALVAGTGVGFVARIPVSAWIANTGAGYADVTQWLFALDYYGRLAAERWAASGGVLVFALTGVLIVLGVVATVVFVRRRAVPLAVVAACSWLAPLLVVVGAIALGTHAARYLQPLAFAPVLVLAVLPDLLPPVRARARSTLRLLASGAAVLVLVAAVVSVPRIVGAAGAADPDLDCVTEWTDASGRTGAGQFWTIRLPKAHVADPRTLVQVDHTLRGYAWLVNRDDFAVGEVTFLVSDAQSPAFELPGGASLDDAAVVACGRYTIYDFGSSNPLPLGPQRS